MARLEDRAPRLAGDYESRLQAVAVDTRQAEDFVTPDGLEKRRLPCTRFVVALDLGDASRDSPSFVLDYVIEGTEDILGFAGWFELVRTTGWSGGRRNKAGAIQPRMAWKAGGNRRIRQTRVRWSQRRAGDVGVSLDAIPDKIIVDRHHSIAVDAIGDGVAIGQNTGGNLSWSHNVGTGNSNLFMLFDLHSWLEGNNIGVHTASYNALAATSIGTTTFNDGGTLNGRTSQFGRIDPTTGNNTAAMTNASSENDNTGISVCYTGVNQTTAANGFQGNGSSGSSSRTVSVTSATGNIVSGAGSAYSPTGWALGADQTELALSPSDIDNDGLWASDEAGATSVTHSYTTSNSPPCSIVACNIIAAGGDPEGPLVGGKLVNGGLLTGGRLVRAR